VATTSALKAVNRIIKMEPKGIIIAHHSIAFDQQNSGASIGDGGEGDMEHVEVQS